MKIKRTLFESLIRELDRPEISIILGPRQVGKTFIMRELEKYAKAHGSRTIYYNLELPFDLVEFNKDERELFLMLTSKVDVVFIDEFHYLRNASKLFKAIYDSGKKVKLIVSGSSSIEIHKHLKESLAGRRLVTKLMPLSFKEYLQQGADVTRLFDEYVIYGGLPGLIQLDAYEEKIRLLNEILETYIQKDIKALIREENIRAFNTLLYLIAEHQGSVISVPKLANSVGLTARTVEKHISILENTYVLYPVHSYARNIGNELKKSRKLYFYDLGMRNTLLKDFSPVNEREDAGIINESFILLQLLARLKPNMEIKFWRNKTGHEIDFVLLENRKPFLIEVKTTLNSPDVPPAMKIFIKNYPDTRGAVVFSRNLEDETSYLGKKILFRKLDAVHSLEIF